MGGESHNTCEYYDLPSNKWIMYDATLTSDFGKIDAYTLDVHTMLNSDSVLKYYADETM